MLAKSDPNPGKVPEGKHFRGKDIAAQQRGHDDHYRKSPHEYREVRTLELMTMVLFYDLTHKERLLGSFLRCEESGVLGGRVSVGRFLPNGLEVFFDFGNSDRETGRTLARKL